MTGIYVEDSLLLIPRYQLADAPAGLATHIPLKFGALYHFSNAGDEVPKHAHDENKNHLSIILQGTVSYEIFTNENSVSTEFSSVSIFKVPPRVQHRFIAKTTDAILINLRSLSVDPDAIAERITKDIERFKTLLHG
jgi:hypothetical protein